MSLAPQLIAPFRTGLDTDVEPWLAPPDSFSVATNVHVRHGYIEKRNGYRIWGQLQGFDTGLTVSAATQADPCVVTVNSTASLTNGQYVYITGVVGMTELNDNIYTVANIAGATFELSGVDSTGFGAYGSAGTVYPIVDSTDRVMGIYRFIQADGSKLTLAFNTTKANLWDGVAEQFLPLDAADIMSGSSADYVWAANWQSSGGTNRLYFTNGKAYDGASLDGIRYYDASGTGNTTTLFTPSVGGSDTLYGGKLLFTLNQRIVVLYTYENDTGSNTSYPQRARWCANQAPGNWDDTVAGGGGYVDAATGDQIISARALQDRIIVFFTNSVWSLVANQDPNRPFIWIKLNSFRACDGKMASVGYDRFIPALGVRGITGTDGIETKRIDDRINQFTYDEVNVDYFYKVFCERSYANQRWWTLFPSVESTENDSALIYDDESGAYTTYDISLNCLGYGNFTEDYALDDFTAANDLDIDLSEAGEDTLLSYFWQDNQETLLGGTTGGIVYILETDGDDSGSAIESTVVSAAWNPFKDEGIECQMSYIDLYVDTDEYTTGTISFFKDDEVSPYAVKPINFLPNLNFYALIQDISQTNPCVVNCANSGLSTGDVVYIYGVEGMGEINGGPYTITVVDDNNFTIDDLDATGYSAYTGGGSVYEREFYKTKVWKRAFAGGIGYQHSIQFYSSGSDKPFRIHAFKPYFKKRGVRTINS